MLRAVIFDMDGLLVDSEPLWVRAEIEVFGLHGLVLHEDDCAQTKGLRVDDVVRYWHARKNLVKADEIERKLVDRVCDLVRAEGRALPGVREALDVARLDGRVIALASSSPTQVIRATLEALELEHEFSVIRSAETETHGKPHPGIFLTTAQHLGVAPVDCLVLEDSLNGIIAAKAARMTCIAVPFDYPKQEARFALADAIVGSLADVTPELVARVSRS